MDHAITPAEGNGWDQSANAWMHLMEQGDPNRRWLLDDIMLGLCGDVRGRDVLDAGCGEGRFCRMLAAHGARTVGVDPTRALIERARSKQPGGVFHEARAEMLPLADASVDLVVSYVALVDVPGYREAISEMARVLRPGGRCVVANMNAFATAAPHPAPWARDESGRKLHWKIDNYMIERPIRAEWAGISITNWHRPLSAYMRAFFATGMRLEHFDEPMPTPEIVAAQTSMNDFHRVPHFCTMAWRR